MKKRDGGFGCFYSTKGRNLLIHRAFFNALTVRWQCFNLIVRQLAIFGCFLGLFLLFQNPSIIFDTMKNRIVSEKDLGEAINLLMEGNLPVSTATVINLVQRLQQTRVAPETEQPQTPKMEAVSDE